jgi:PKD repeat protein
MKSVPFILSFSLTLALAASPGVPPIPPGQTHFTVSLAADKMEGQAPLQVKFTATANQAATYTWYVNDRQLKADTPKLTYTFKHAEAYVVTVSATNGAGNVANASTTTTVR